MSVTKVLLDILIVLLAAKAAAEVAERLRVPAVVGEIVAGIIIGPSVLHLVQGDEVLRVLGELGVILLLLEVGLEMDIAELGAVGRASLTVATVGVIAPFVAGYGVGLAWGMTAKEAIFVGAALTATSVGITARVFGDLRALATVEARTVLGAAVADDVMGLVILTVVVRVVSQGTVSPLTVAGVVLVAVAFLVVTSLAGIRIVPSLFAFVARHSRSSGTLVAVGLAFTLGFAELANAAKLAPIVGAFVAGLALGRSTSADRIRRELRPVGHLFIPVFFLQIGIDAEISQFARPSVLGLAAALLVVAVAGKLISAAGLLGAPGDRLLVGIGMIPRGEVGLIFAAIGLREHIFGESVYGSLLLVVLATTLLTPPVLRWRLMKMRSARTGSAGAIARPPGGWLVVDRARETFDIVHEPPPGEALTVALDAALLGDTCRPGPAVLDWLASLPTTPMRWDRPARESLFRLLEKGGPRAWRFLALTGVLERALPELGEALNRRQTDAFELDPISAVRWPRLARVHELNGRVELDRPERLHLAAVILDATDGGQPGVVAARRVAQRLDLGAAAEQSVAGLVGDAELLHAASRRIDSGNEEQVLQLATHLATREQADALYLLTVAGNGLEPFEQARLDELHALVDSALARPELTGRQAGNLVEQRRAQAGRLTTDRAVQERIAAAPRAYVLRTPASDLARHAALCEPPIAGDEVRCLVEHDADGWRVDVAARDRVGLLARETEALAEEQFDIYDAVAVTWGDGCALASFRVAGTAAPDAERLRAIVQRELRTPLHGQPAPDITVTFDDDCSPWHTVCRAAAPDRPGLLQALTTAFAAASTSVHAATITTAAGQAVDEFELTDRNGHKLGEGHKKAIRTALEGGVAGKKRVMRLARNRNK